MKILGWSIISALVLAFLVVPCVFLRPWWVWPMSIGITIAFIAVLLVGLLLAKHDEW